jgi:hypothetical protein
MSTRFAGVIIVFLIGSMTMAGDDERQLKVVTSRATTAIESITVYVTKDGKRQAAGELTKLDQPLKLPNDGPFEVVAKPKGGSSITLVEKLTLKNGQTHELKLDDLIGTVEVFGDNFPRADKIVLTDERDPGPGEKGHAPVQSASEYRVDMAVTPGFYSVWVVPANGARAQRVVDRVRVLAGKSVRVGD